MEIDATVIERLASARSVVAFTGAGMSAESGVPTFRDAQTGLWQHYDPADLATPEAFQRDPALVWQWYSWRRQLAGAAEPNAGHLALADWASLSESFSVVTQNVDSLHQRAGNDIVLELHGNLHRDVCSHELTPVRDPVPPDVEGAPPRCPQCAAPLRPDVVWFGEMLPQKTWQAALQAAADADVLLSIGTSGLVQPAASIPEVAMQQGALVIEINPEPTPLSDAVALRLAGSAAEVLPALVRRLTERR